MRRYILTFATLSAAAFFAGDASACHKKVACAAPAPVCAPAPVVECAPPPVVECAPVAKKHCFHMPKFSMPKFGCHKKAACAPAPVACEGYAAPAPVYGAPMASPQVMPTAQASLQG